MGLVHWILGDLPRLEGISMVMGSELPFAVDGISAMVAEQKGKLR